MSRPNASELALLKYLWSGSPRSAREIHESVGPSQGWKASTTRTVLNRMEAKGWVSRDDSGGLAVYTPELERVATLGAMVRHLARQVLDMDGALPAAMFADSPHLSEEEIEELNEIINAADKGE